MGAAGASLFLGAGLQHGKHEEQEGREHLSHLFTLYNSYRDGIAFLAHPLLALSCELYRWGFVWNHEGDFTPRCCMKSKDGPEWRDMTSRHT